MWNVNISLPLFSLSSLLQVNSTLSSITQRVLKIEMRQIIISTRIKTLSVARLHHTFDKSPVHLPVKFNFNLYFNFTSFKFTLNGADSSWPSHSQTKRQKHFPSPPSTAGSVFDHQSLVTLASWGEEKNAKMRNKEREGANIRKKCLSHDTWRIPFDWPRTGPRM